MNAVHGGAEVERARTHRVHGVAARHVPRQLRVLAQHLSGRRPRRIDALRGDLQRSLPAALLTGNGDRIADRFAGLGDPVEAAVAEAHDDLAGTVLHSEAHDLLAAAAYLAAASPEPAQALGLRCCRCDRHEGREGQGGAGEQSTGGCITDHSRLRSCSFCPPHGAHGLEFIFSGARGGTLCAYAVQFSSDTKSRRHHDQGASPSR